VNFQPATEAAPAGYLKDAGSVYSVRSNGKSYGWNNGISLDSRIRRGAVPIPELDTLIHMQKGGPTKIWEYALPNGSYPVIVVAGDPSHRDQTNNLSIEGIQVIDPDPSAPQGYEKGDFDGYAVQVTITDGRLTIQPGSGAVNAKICYVEIGAEGTTIDQATQDRLAALIESATTQTAATVQSTTAKRQYVFGSYVDELISYTVGSSRSFVHSNHLYSPSAVTNTAGQVQERYRYDAYGKQTITTATGTVRNQSAVGFSRGFTGYILDEETELYYARARMYSAGLGRFTGRDPLGYINGESLYQAYFVPNYLDPTGLETYEECTARCTATYEPMLVKIDADLQRFRDAAAAAHTAWQNAVRNALAQGGALLGENTGLGGAGGYLAGAGSAVGTGVGAVLGAVSDLSSAGDRYHDAFAAVMPLLQAKDRTAAELANAERHAPAAVRRVMDAYFLCWARCVCKYSH